MSDERIDLLELWKVLWRAKWLIALITGAFTVGAIAYAVLAQPWYQANVLLAPAPDAMAEGAASPLSGLLALSGAGPSGGNSVQALAVLKSRSFAREFIEDNKLLEVVLFEDWNPETKTWKEADPAEQPDIRDAVTYFHDNVQNVEEDPLTGLATLSISWIDAAVAKQWAEELVRRLNDRMRTAALHEAETNVAYLQAELAKTTVVSLQQSISGLLETELQKLMMARGNEEFAYRTIDPPEVPNEPARPNRLVIVVLGFLVGGALALAFVLARHIFRRAERERSGAPA